ncbi:hypothetical protein [Cryptosporangium aurantiacum]|uniref:hypothetical protein n=1 Tax=Cryptosporangium aurantiacum TaxID=134849 RepID=UPI001C4A1A52|nr:hypothetical protein [Cryptosporangium aurantiacum]
MTLSAQAANADDDPPATCPPDLGCISRVEKPRVPGRTADQPAVAAEPQPGGAAGQAAPGQVALTPAQAAEQAVSFLPLRGPEIGVAPSTDGQGLVGLPVWLWTEVTPETWGPLEQTTAVTGIAVTVRAEATSITWELGDGTVITCNGPGTPYDASYGNAESPDCGHRYTKSSRSQADGVYTVTGTTHWNVVWQIVGTAETGVIATTAQSETQIRIDELQVVSQ